MTPGETGRRAGTGTGTRRPRDGRATKGERRPPVGQLAHGSCLLDQL